MTSPVYAPGLVIEDLSISVKKKSKHLHQKARHSIVEDISLKCRPGEVLAIFGGSGSGKSTILSYISGRLEASSNYKSTTASLSFNGEQIREKDLGRLGYFVPCYSELLPFLTAIQAVTFEDGLRGSKYGIRRSSDELMHILNSVGIEDPNKSINGYMTTPLTEAELRKLGLAMSMVANAEIVLFDEPTSFVSEANAIDILNFIIATTKQRANVSIITCHQPTIQQLELLNQILVLFPNGEKAFEGTPRQALAHIAHGEGENAQYIRSVLLGEQNLRGGEGDASSDDHSSASIEELINMPRDDPRKHDHERPKSCKGSRTLKSLFMRTFFFRWQNPFAFASVIAVMVVWAFLFGAVFFNVGGKINDTAINNIITLPQIDLPEITVPAYVSDWTDAITNGVGPEKRQPFVEGILPPKEKRSLTPPMAARAAAPGLAAADAIMDLSFCATNYWRIVERWDKDYEEVIPGTYEAMFADNTSLTGYVVPSTKASALFPDSPMDRMVLTLHELALTVDYLLTSRSGLMPAITRCVGSYPESPLFYLCAKELLLQADGLLACGGLPVFTPKHAMHSPWELPSQYPSTWSAPSDETRAAPAEEEDLSLFQKFLSPIMGGISLGAGIVFILGVVAFGMFPIIINYWTEREGANRDTIARSYSTMSFFLAKSMADFLFEWVPIIILSLLFTALLGLKGSQFWSVQAMTTGVAWAHGAYAYLFTAISRHKGMAMGLFSTWTFISLLFSGFMLRVGDMPAWCAWWRFFSCLYWAYGGCMTTFFPVPPKGSLSLGTVILTALGVTDEWQGNFGISIAALFVTGLVIRAVACVAQVLLHRDIGTQSDYYSQ